MYINSAVELVEGNFVAASQKEGFVPRVLEEEQQREKKRRGKTFKLVENGLQSPSNRLRALFC